MEDDRIRYSTLHYLITEAIQAYEDGDTLLACRRVDLIVNWAEERSLMERSRTLQEVLKLIESERKNFTDKSLYNRIIKTIESRALNNAVILHQITAEHALFREWAETADEEPKESEKGSQNEGKY